MPEAGGEAEGGLLGGQPARGLWGKVGPRLAPLPAEAADLPLSQSLRCH